MTRFQTTSITIIALLALSLFVVGCGSDDGPDTSGPGGTDTTPPAIGSVTGIDANHVEVAFDENVSRATAEFRGNYAIVEAAIPRVPAGGSPGDSIRIETASLGTDNRTVTLTTSDPMGNLPYEVSVMGVSDTRGNAIGNQVSQTFTGSNAADTTPPAIASRTPSPGATGVAVGQPVIVTFSEPMDFFSVITAFSWTFSGGSVAFDAASEENNEFSFTPVAPLAGGTTYTVAIAATAQDWAGNPLAAANWTFTTTSQMDNTPPTLLSSTPMDGATNVALGTNFRLNFSEAINQTELNINVSPDPGDGVLSFTNNGATLNFDPVADLMVDTQYNILIPAGGIEDLAGNASTASFSLTFTTGASLASGSVSGTVSGDPGTAAVNPAGAILIASSNDPVSGNEDDPVIVGQTTVGAGGTYTVGMLPDDDYWLLSVLDSNGDGSIDPDFGDAIGAFGADFSGGQDEVPDPVTIAGGAALANVNFQLYDLSVISGNVTYAGTTYNPNGLQWNVGVFDTTGFDLNGTPVSIAEEDDFFPGNSVFVIGEEAGLVDGTFYVGGFLDVNGNFIYDDGEPFGFHGGIANPTPITIANGSDELEIDVVLMDDLSARMMPWTSAVQKPSPERARLIRRIKALGDALP